MCVKPMRKLDLEIDASCICAESSRCIFIILDTVYQYHRKGSNEVRFFPVIRGRVMASHRDGCGSADLPHVNREPQSGYGHAFGSHALDRFTAPPDRETARAAVPDIDPLLAERPER